MSRTYIVYDERVWGLGNPDIGVMEFDTDNATILVACDSLAEAKGYIRDHFEGGVVLSYNDTEEILTDQRYEYYDERRGK